MFSFSYVVHEVKTGKKSFQKGARPGLMWVVLVLRKPSIFVCFRACRRSGNGREKHTKGLQEHHIDPWRQYGRPGGERDHARSNTRGSVRLLKVLFSKFVMCVKLDSVSFFFVLCFSVYLWYKKKAFHSFRSLQLVRFPFVPHSLK